MEGDVWICMEVMDTSLDKFYAKVYKFGRKIPEQILGPITVAVIYSFFFSFNNLYRTIGFAFDAITKIISNEIVFFIWYLLLMCIVLVSLLVV